MSVGGPHILVEGDAGQSERVRSSVLCRCQGNDVWTAGMDAAARYFASAGARRLGLRSEHDIKAAGAASMPNGPGVRG